MAKKKKKKASSYNLVTEQPLEIAVKLLEDPSYVFRCEPRLSEHLYYRDDDSQEDLIEDEAFTRAYDFISKELSKKSPKPESLQYPVWSWYEYSSKKGSSIVKKLSKKTLPGNVLIEFTKPSKDVLLSNFYSWHEVLNNCPVFFEDEYKEQEREALSKGIDPFDYTIEIWDSFTQESKEKTWLKNISKKALKETDTIQAVTWEIKSKDIVAVHLTKNTFKKA